MRIISADLGGTKTLLRISEVDASGTHLVREARLESGLFPSFEELLIHFLQSDHAPFDAACFAVAGPAQAHEAWVTNLHWVLSAGSLRDRFSIRRLALINDFHAVASGIFELQPEDLITINDRPRDPLYPAGIVGAGTGLGEAIVLPLGETSRVMPSEGGHASFAPRGEIQRRLLAHLEEQFGHVSYERLLSGPGIVNIFTFLCTQVHGRSLAEAGIDEARGQVAAQVAELADAGSEIARETFEIFIDVYGAEAGNLALKVLARSGLFVAGGIAAKHLHRFQDGRFLSAYADKGRMRDLLLEFPLYVVANPQVGLLGATATARRLLDEIAAS